MKRTPFLIITLLLSFLALCSAQQEPVAGVAALRLVNLTDGGDLSLLVDGQVLIPQLGSGETSGYLLLPLTKHRLELVSQTSPEEKVASLAVLSLTLTAGGYHTVVITESETAGERQLHLLKVADGPIPLPPPGAALLRIVNTFASATLEITSLAPLENAPANPTQLGESLVSALPPAAASDFLALAAGPYRLQVGSSELEQPVTLPEVVLEVGVVYTLYIASGGDTPQATITVEGMVARE